MNFLSDGLVPERCSLASDRYSAAYRVSADEVVRDKAIRKVIQIIRAAVSTAMATRVVRARSTALGDVVTLPLQTHLWWVGLEFRHAGMVRR